MNCGEFTGKILVPILFSFPIVRASLSYFSVHKFTGTLSAALEIPCCSEDTRNNICCRVRTDSQSCWSWSVLRICIRVSLSTLMWIRIWLFTWCGSGSVSFYSWPLQKDSNLRPLIYRPSTTLFWDVMALFWASTALYSIAKVVFEHPLSTDPVFGLWCVSRSGVT